MRDESEYDGLVSPEYPLVRGGKVNHGTTCDCSAFGRRPAHRCCQGLESAAQRGNRNGVDPTLGCQSRRSTDGGRDSGTGTTGYGTDLAQAGLEPDEAWPLDRLQKALQKQTRRTEKNEKQQRRGSQPEPAVAASADGPRPSEATQAEPSAAVPGFGRPKDDRAVKGFDEAAPPAAQTAAAEGKPASNNADATPESQRKPSSDEARIRRLAQGLLRRYDRNRSGVLEKEEWSRMRGDPEQSDANRDGILTEDELATRLADYGRGNRAPAAESSRNSAGPAPSPTPARVATSERPAQDKERAAQSTLSDSYGAAGASAAA